MRAVLLALLLCGISAFGSREYLSASSQFMTAPSAVSTYPVTISAWVYPYSTNGTFVAAGLFLPGASESRRMLMMIQNGLARVDGIPNAGGSAVGASSTAPVVLNAWNHVVGVFSSSTSRTIYLNGGNSAVDTTAATTSGLTTIGIGARHYLGAWGLHLNGCLAEVGIWNEALDANEVRQLYTRKDLRKIRPKALVFFPPLWGASTPEIDLIRGVTIGHTNAPAGLNGFHPPIYRK